MIFWLVVFIVSSGLLGYMVAHAPPWGFDDIEMPLAFVMFVALVGFWASV